jgi:hypothetical protein
MHLFPDKDPVTALIRGSLPQRPLKPVGALREKDSPKLILYLIDSGEHESARLVAVARSFMTRTFAELLPAQLDGRDGISPGSTAWHSQIHFSKKEGRSEGHLVLRSRKNSPFGAVISRPRFCSSTPTVSTALCGHCALVTQISRSVSAGAQSHDSIWAISAARSSLIIQAACAALHLPLFGWHALRRGMALDLFEAGVPLEHILLSGGWRSTAPLRRFCRREPGFRVFLEASLAFSDSE